MLRVNGNPNGKFGAMQDGSTAIAEPVELAFDLSKRAKKLELDFSKPLKWKTPTVAMEEFHFLVQRPPLHSVVIEIGPAMAEHLLLLSNTRNRPQVERHIGRIGAEISEDDFVLTGDTVKFSKSGILLDGQHRLFAAIKAKEPITTHIVFGLEDEVFDVLDQGKKRTPGDVLALCGVSDHNMVAGAVSWVLKLKSGNTLEGGAGLEKVTPRHIRKLALGEMKDIGDYIRDARLINIAYKHPPTLIAALLYLIGRQSAGVARDFAHEWVHGAKIGRNKNFDVLNQRLLNIGRQNAGTINRNVRAALLIQTFNYWNAHLVASPRSLVWQKGWTFPILEMNKEKFQKVKEMEAREDTSASAVNHRVLRVLTELMDKSCEVMLSNKEIAELANVSPHSVLYIVGELMRQKRISVSKKGNGTKPATYRVAEPAATILGAA